MAKKKPGGEWDPAASVRSLWNEEYDEWIKEKRWERLGYCDARDSILRQTVATGRRVTKVTLDAVSFVHLKEQRGMLVSTNIKEEQEIGFWTFAFMGATIVPDFTAREQTIRFTMEGDEE